MTGVLVLFAAGFLQYAVSSRHLLHGRTPDACVQIAFQVVAAVVSVVAVAIAASTAVHLHEISEGASVGNGALATL